jgi:hypothetical protein
MNFLSTLQITPSQKDKIQLFATGPSLLNFTKPDFCLFSKWRGSSPKRKGTLKTSLELLETRLMTRAPHGSCELKFNASSIIHSVL